MSAFLPINPAYGQQQKRALLERLLQQHMQNAARYAGQAGEGGGESAPVASVGSTPFRSSHPFGGAGLVVQVPHPTPAGLGAELGPGAMPRAGYNPASSLMSFLSPHGMGRSTAFAPEGSGAVMPTPTPANPAAPSNPLPPGTLSTIHQIVTGPSPASSQAIPASFLTPQFAGTPQANGAARANVFNPGTGFFIPRFTGGGVF